MSLPRVMALLAAPLLLAACAGKNLETAGQVTPQGSEFEQRLYAHYIDLAGSEHEQGDYRDSDRFAERAIAAVSGAAPEPEELKKRDLRRVHRDELADARSRLLAAFANGARDTIPDGAARAQVMFDCWVEQQEENFQPEHIAACRDGFNDALSGVEQRLAAAPEAVPVTPQTEIAEAVTLVYGVNFDFDSDALRDDAEPVLHELLAMLENRPNVTVRVEGHADALGGESYNQGLSWRRAQSVVNWLVSNGVAAARLVAEGMGETLPVADNTTDAGRAANRRAEMTLLAN